MGALGKGAAVLGAMLRQATSALNLLGSIALLAMMLLGVADISGRWLFNRPIPGAFEATEFLLAFVVFFALAYTQRVGGHVRVLVITGRLSRRSQRLLDIAALAIALGLLLVITWKGFGYFWASWRIRETTVGLVNLPLYPALFSVPLGAAFFSLQLLSDLLRRLLSANGEGK